MNTKPTAAAMRVANGIAACCLDRHGNFNIERAAQIIDREFAELVEATSETLEICDASTKERTNGRQNESQHSRLRSALAKLNAK